MDTPSLAAMFARFRPRFRIDPCAKLPAELIALVFSHFDTATLLQCSRVSKSWRRRALDPFVWKNLYFSEGWRFNFNAVRLLEEELASGTHHHKTPNHDSEPFIGSSMGLDSPWNPQNERIEADDDDDKTSHHSITNHISHRDGCPSSSFLERFSQLSTNAASSPSYIFDKKSLSIHLNWYKLYQLRYELEQSWKKGRCTGFTLPSPDHPEESHNDFVYALQQVGKWLVSGSRDMTVAVWDLETKRLRGRPLRGHEQSVLCLQFDPDPSQDVIISGGSDKKVIVWKFSTGEMLTRINDAHADSVLNLAFDSRYLITCSKDKTIKLWNRTTLRAGDPLVPKPANTDNVRLSPALAGLLSGEVSHIEPYSHLFTLHGHTSAVNAIQLRGNECTSASGDRSIRVWNIRTGQCLRTYNGHTKGIACVQTDGRTIISGSNDSTIRIFSRKKGTQLARLGGHTSLVRTVQGYIPDADGEDKNGRPKTGRDGLDRSNGDSQDESSNEEFTDTLSDYYMDVAADVAPTAFSNPGPTQQRRRKRSISSSSVSGAAAKYARIVSGSYDGSIRIWNRNKKQQWTRALSFTVNSILRNKGGQLVKQDSGSALDRERVFKVQFDVQRLIVGSQNPTIAGLEFGIRKHEPEVYGFFEL